MAAPERDATRENRESPSGRLPDGDFIDLLQQHRTQVLGYLYCLVRNQADAEDLFQQVSLTMWDKFSEFEPGTNFSAWAFAIARNVSLDFLRSRERERARFSDELVIMLSQRNSWTPQEADHRLAALAQCQRKLSKADQSLLAMCYGSGATAKEVAQLLGRPAESVYTSLSRVRRALYSCIQRTIAREGLR